MRRMIIKRLYAAILVLIIGLLTINLLTLTVNAFNKPQDRFKEVIVHKDDTLWTIAEQVTPNGQDVRNTVYIIRKVNRLNTAILQPGQRILIPREE